MKKIISAAAIAATVASLATAEVKVKIDSKTEVEAYSLTQKNDAKNENTITDTVLANIKDSSGDIEFTASGDSAEVKAKLKLKDSDDSVNIDTTYYGKLKFGALNFTGGKTDSRYSLAYNKKTTEIGLTDDVAGKYGVVYSSTKTDNWFWDNNNTAAEGSTRVLSFITDYTFEDVAGGKLLLKAGALNCEKSSSSIKGDWRDKVTDDDGNTTKKVARYVLNAGYALPDVASFEVAARLASFHQQAYSFIVAPTAVKGLAAGFTYAMDSLESSKYSAFAIDAGYAGNPVADLPLQVVAQVKYSSLTSDGGDAETVLLGALGLGYQINDMIKAAFDFRVDMYDLDDNNEADENKNSIILQPAVQFIAGAGSIQTGVKFTKYLDSDAKDLKTMSVLIPVTMKIAL